MKYSKGRSATKKHQLPQPGGGVELAYESPANCRTLGGIQEHNLTITAATKCIYLKQDQSVQQQA